MSIIRKEQLTSPLSASYATTASYAKTQCAYGSYYQATVQGLPNIGIMNLSSVEFESGITLGGGNNIYLTESGIYNFEVKVHVSDNTNADTINFFLNDSTYTGPIPSSAITVDHISSNPALLSWSCLVYTAGGSNIQLYGGCSSGTNTNTIAPNNGGYPIAISVIKIA